MLEVKVTNKKEAYNIPQVSIVDNSKLINLVPNPEPRLANQLDKHVAKARIQLIVLTTDKLKCI